MKDVRGRSIVVTGATSGVGYRTACLLAERGARLTLIARRQDALDRAAEECRARGAEVIVAALDTVDEEAIDSAAVRASEAFGSLDGWVNNAAVLSAGRFEDTPSDVFRRIIETNVIGYANGARAALRRFRLQGHGVLVNTGSTLGVTAVPLLSAYVASKFAVRGFSDSLRIELLDEPNIHICTVLPATVDTPLWDHCANFTRRALRPIPPIYSPEHVAEVVVGMLEDPKPEAVAGGFGWVIRAARLVPRRVLDPVIARIARLAIGSEHRPPTSGNVLVPPAPTTPRAHRSTSARTG